MKYVGALVGVGLVLSSTDGAFAEDGDKQAPTAHNTIYAELGGPGGLYSENYERRIKDFNVRVGLAYFGNDYISMTTIPLGVNYIGVGGRNNHLELGAVATIAIIDGDDWLGNSSGVIASGLVGYRYQPPYEGFNFRIGASPLIGAGGVVPWGYISLGGTFSFGATPSGSRRKEPRADE